MVERKMDKTEAKRLLDSYLRGQCTPEEKKLVEAWYNDAISQKPNVSHDHDWEALERHMTTNLPIIRPFARRRRYTYAAAALALIALTVGWVYFSSEPTAKPQVVTVENDMSPGVYKAKLTFEDGRKIELFEHEELIIGSNGLRFPDGSKLDASLPPTADESGSLELTTPVGGQYRVLLPDGSRVWLNASSSLTYPKHFNSDSREINLSGEAYLEVEKQVVGGKKIPFIVHTTNQQIMVLGTSFNVNAYPFEQQQVTTLISGAVSVASIDERLRKTDPGSVIFLLPGQKAVQSNGRIAVSDAKIESAIAWKNGNFSFEDESLDMIMRQLQRWYGFSIDEGSLPELHFTGGIKRDVSLSKVLEMLEATSNVSFDVDDGHVTVNHHGEIRME